MSECECERECGCECECECVPLHHRLCHRVESARAEFVEGAVGGHPRRRREDIRHRRTLLEDDGGLWVSHVDLPVDLRQADPTYNELKGDDHLEMAENEVAVPVLALQVLRDHRWHALHPLRRQEDVVRLE